MVGLLTPNKEFTKYDSEKPGFHIISSFQHELGIINRCMEYGAKKYGLDNWRMCKPEEFNRYRNALTRHSLSSYSQYLDNESGLPHLAHISTNALFLMHLQENLNGLQKKG